MVCWGRDSTTCWPKCKEWRTESMTALRTESRAEWMRLPMVAGAKVQIGLRPVQRCKSGMHSQVPGLGHRVSGSGVQVQVQVPGLTPVPECPHPKPEARDQKMSSLSSRRFEIAAHSPRISAVKLAGKDGVEPSPADLETAVLP